MLRALISFDSDERTTHYRNTFQIPRFDSIVLIELTSCTNCGCDFSKPPTDDDNPLSESCNNSGFCSARVASWAESSVNPAMLCASLLGWFGERVDLGFQRPQQLQQLAFAVVLDGIRRLNFRFDIADRYP